MQSALFARLVHADWSTTANKRWAAEARKISSGWIVEAPHLVGSVDQFVRDLLHGSQPALAGFDFPIGVPAAFGRRTNFAGFDEAIQKFGQGDWLRFYDVADRAEEISTYRPFYPRVSSSFARQSHLLTAHKAPNIDVLRRQCEKATSNRRAACSLFWTLGGNQVGKAAISGWREVVQPARRAGAKLWPFDGDLSTLANAGTLVICETYPGEAYRHIDVRITHGGSKQRQADRLNATVRLADRCRRYDIHLTTEMTAVLKDGFGGRKDGEDAFDAVVGLLGMIEVVEGRRPAAPARIDAPEWEGWILGQVA